ncbi:MAG TPA: hypothetical protein PLQ76_09750 [bacterium]|nr:hypothetical protein [bacterium]
MHLPVEPTKMWLFWGTVIVLTGALLYILFGYPLDTFKDAVTKKKTQNAEEFKPNKVKINKKLIRETIDGAVELGKDVRLDPKKAILVTKKAACKQNVQIIETMVELWAVKHDGQYPAIDLSDIGRDRDYFPRGIPPCPVDGTPYKLDPVSHRIMGHEHTNIKTYELEKQLNTITGAGK